MPINIAITGVGSLFGQGLVKSLKLSSLDYRLVAFDFFPHAVGLYWADKSYLLPDLLSNQVTEEQYLETLIYFLKKEKIEVLFPGTDFEISLLSHNQSLIESEVSCHVVVSPPEVVEICDDKWKTALFLSKSGFEAPESLVNLDELGAFIHHVGFPLIVKPRCGYRSRGVSVVYDQKELSFALKNAGESPIVQRMIGKKEEEYTCGAVVLHGECLGVIVMRRDLRDGNTFRAYLESQPNLEGIVKKMALALKPFGSVNFQLRLEKNVPYVFEINSRFSGTSVMRSLAGFNEMEAIIQRLIFKTPALLTCKKRGVFLRYWEEMFVSWDDFHRMEKGGLDL